MYADGLFISIGTLNPAQICALFIAVILLACRGESKGGTEGIKFRALVAVYCILYISDVKFVSSKLLIYYYRLS